MPFESDRAFRNAGGDGRVGTMPVGEKLRITDANLARLDETIADVAERRCALLAEKVRAMVSAISNEYPDDVYDRLVREEHFPETFLSLAVRECQVPEDTLCTDDVMRTLTAVSAEETVALCRGLAHVNDRMYRVTDGVYNDRWVRQISDLIREDEHIEDDTAPDLEVRAPRTSGERIAYLRNTYTDIAYERFAHALHHAGCTYYSDFPGVCEALYYDHATACILPMENSQDGKLLRFYSLLMKYDLRIAAVTSVTAEDTDVTTRYALLRKAVTVPHPEEEYLGLYLECRTALDEDLPLGSILGAAAAYRMTLVRVDTVPTLYEEDDRITYDLILRAEEDADIAAMLTYFYLMVPGFTLLGLYPDL